MAELLQPGGCLFCDSMADLAALQMLTCLLSFELAAGFLLNHPGFQLRLAQPVAEILTAANWYACKPSSPLELCDRLADLMRLE